MSRIEEQGMPDGQSTVLGQGHRPRMASAAVAMSQAVYQESRLSLREAEAARIRIAHINGCLLCKNFRVADDLGELMSRLNAADQVANVRDRGERPSNAFYEAILAWRESDLFSERERLAIEYAERISLSPEDLPYDDSFWDRLRQQFDDGEIVDLTYSITTWIATGRFVHVLGLDGACPTDFTSQAQSAA
jgi:alkylhydroperoxidase family enzyme